jgi:excisionase family DNA binding protein
MEEPLMTPEQVAGRLQVADQTVYNLLRAGHLRGIRIGRLWRVRPADLDTFLKVSSNDAAWREQFEALLARVRGRIPHHITEEEIESDASAAVARARERIRAGGC